MPAIITPRWINDLFGWNIASLQSEKLGKTTGYLGDIFLITFSPPQSFRGDEVRNVVGKFTPLAPDLMDMFKTVKIHEAEVDFYKFSGDLDLAMPKMLASHVNPDNGGGYVFMTYIDNAVPPPFSSGLNCKQAEVVLKEIAKLHALPLNMDVVPPTVKSARSRVDKFLQSAYADSLPEFLRLLEEKLSPEAVTMLRDLNVEELTATANSSKRPHVLCHGDLWSNNILFSRLDSGASGDDLKAILDWQFVHIGAG
eukprot:Rmarinus@m.21946